MEKRKEGGSDVWTTLLSDCAGTTRSSFSTDKSVVILGEELSGKSVLATKLQGADEPHRGSALDFQVIEIEDEDVDESGVCRLWIVDGNLAYRSLLQFALPSSMVSRSVVIITVDMAQPWIIPETLDKWTRVLFEHVDSLKINHIDMEDLRQKLVDQFLGYVDPTLSTDSKNETKLILTKTDDNKVESAQLGDVALSENLGIPVIVVCTKCDQIETLESEYDYKEEHFDFIQHYLRQYCLKLGAALIYTSIKESKNMEVLKKYLLHKLYGFPFTIPASVIDRDGIFVPIGWDSEKKISIVSDNFLNVSASDPFMSVISRPTQTRILSQDMKEMMVEDEQSFLAKAQVVLNKAPVSNKAAAGDASMRSKIRVAQDAGRIGFGSLPGAGASPKGGKADITKPGANNERMLANFFNSLLNKKTGSPTAGTQIKAGQVNAKASPARNDESKSS